MADQRLVDYAKEFLQVTCRPNEAIAVTVEQIADFAALLRAGCFQDTIRLLQKCIRESNDAILYRERDVLQSLGEVMEGTGPELWGLPDCQCDRVDCVYCGPRIAKRVLAEST